MPPQDILKLRQQAAQAAYDKMIAAIIGYTPCADLRINDVQYIARVAQTLAFEASEFAA